MAKTHKYLKLRGKTYVLRVPVPKKIQEEVGKLEITRSLKTRDLDLANKLYAENLNEIQKQCLTSAPMSQI